MTSKEATPSSKSVIFYRRNRTEIILFSLWGVVNLIIFVWKFYTIKAKCDSGIKGPFALFGDTAANAPCQASYASCCKPYPYPNGPVLDPHFQPCDGGCPDDACNLIGRVLGHLLNFNLSLTILPILRNSFWAKLFMKFPFERSVLFHRWIGLFIFITMIIHGATWWYTNPFPSPAWVCWAVTFGFRSDQFNGQIAFLFHAIAGLFALEYFRRKYFEVFFYTHIMYLGLFAFAVWHTAGVQNYWGWDLVLNFEDDYFIYWLAIPFIMLVVDKAYRFYLSNFVPTQLVNVEQDKAGRITKLVVERKGFQFASGQYCFLSIPEISHLQWHPFTISSSPEKPDRFTFHIKSMGHNTWTDDLFKLASRKKAQFKLKVDGPYGAKSLLPKNFRVNALFCGGIGATPMISILSELVQRPELIKDTEVVYFHWVIRDKKNLVWFKPLWYQIFNNRMDESHHIKIGHVKFVFVFHITQGTERDRLVNHNKIHLVNENHDDNTTDGSPLLSVDNMSDIQFEGLIPEQCFSYGRPNMKNIFDRIREDNYDITNKIAVYSCGPASMTEQIQIQAAQHTDDRMRFEVHEETFYL